MTHIITLAFTPEDGQVQVITSEGLDLATTRKVLSAGLSAISEREMRERIEAELAEKAAQWPVSIGGSQPPVLDG